MLRRVVLNVLVGLLVVPWLSLPASGQVHYRDGSPWDQRARSGADAKVPGWYYNLGVTGLRAELVADQPKALVVRYVFEQTPAHGKVQAGDVIVGVNGRPFQEAHRNGYGMEVFGGHGPIREFAAALEACTAEDGSGRLVLKVRRDGALRDVELRINKKLGSYARTFPIDCEKSERIYRFLLGYLVESQRDNGSFGDPVDNVFACLALLASRERKYLPAIEKNLRYMVGACRLSEGVRPSGLMNWTYMGTAIVLSEYYLLTKEPWALAELEKLHEVIQAGQYLDMSQINPKSKETHPGAVPKGPMDSHGGWGHNPGFEGYGPIAMITAQGALAYALMDKCGIEIDRQRLDAAYNFLDRGTAPNGYVWYGDQLGGGPNAWADMGRTGASGIAFALSPYKDAKYAKRARLHSRVIGEHPQSFPDTHGSPPMGMAYAALAANLRPDNFRKLMDDNRWWFTMAHCADDGTFYYQPNRDNAGYGSDSRMSASSVVAFIYSIPRKSLVITGRQGALIEVQDPDESKGPGETDGPRLTPGPAVR